MTEQQQSTSVTPIGMPKQLFIDDFGIDSQHHIQRTLHPFKRYSAGPILVSEKVWERSYFLYATVLRDPGNGVFRM